MKIDSSYVGMTLKDYFTVIDWRTMMNYAAAIDDDNPLYFDDEGGRRLSRRRVRRQHDLLSRADGL